MPYKFREHTVKPEVPKSRLPRIIGVVIALGLVVSTPYAWSRFQAWSDRRHLGRAQRALAQGDYKGALLEARSILERGHKSAFAQQVVDRATEALKAPEELSWKRTATAMERGDDDQLLGIAEAVLESSDFITAERALNRISTAQRDNPKYHDLLARVAAGKGDATMARIHWEEAARLAPDDERYRIQPVALRLLADDPGERAEALASLGAMAKTEAGALPARRALVADARRREDRASARELAAELATTPGAEFGDKLVLLDSLHALRPKRNDEFNECLAGLQQQAAANPPDAFALATWMLDHDLAFLVIEWAGNLPPEIFSQMPAAPALAQAYAMTADWKPLKRLVDSANWGDQDFVRLAFLALSLERQGNNNASKTMWHDAVAAAEVSPDRLEKLARACSFWGWNERAEEVLWKLGPSEWCPRWVMDALWASALRRKDTARLREAAHWRLRMDPQNAAMRNNEANLILLLGEADDATYREAQAVHEEQPQSVEIATTDALALLLQGQAKQAVKVMEAYSSAQLHQSAVALYYGVVLAAAGQTERAPEFLDLAETAPKFPEEAALARVFAQVCEARLKDQHSDAEGANIAWAEALRGCERQPVWLDLLAKTAIDWNWNAGADAALLKIATEDRCPPGLEERLWAAASKTGDENQMYRASRLLARVKPNDSVARSRYVLLAVLGQRSKEPPVALAERLVQDFPTSSAAAAALALALVEQGNAERAVQVLGALSPTQRQEPRVMLYSGIVQAAVGNHVEAAQQIEAGSASTQYAEERTLVEMLRASFATASAESRGDINAADLQWSRALATAGERADWIEILARIAMANSRSRHADMALWKLADGENCPAWVAQALWTSAAKTGTSDERYRASKLLAKSDPKNLTARCTWITLGLLTNQEVDAPEREAKTVYSTNVIHPYATTTYALALFLQKQPEEAVKLLSGLAAAQPVDPRISFYLGVFLAANGETEKASTYLQAAAQAQLLPEERAFAARVITAEPLKKFLDAWPSTPVSSTAY